MSVVTSVSYIDISNNEPDSIQARINAKSIIIPTSVVEIADNSFEDSIVESIIFMGDSQLKTIGKAAFKNCKFLKSIQIPPSVVEIADGAFFDSSLEEIVFIHGPHGSQLKTIGKGVFRDCHFLKSIEIPSSVLKIGETAFSGSNIQTLIFTDDSRLETIGEFAFDNCKSLESIKIPSSVVAIGYAAFSESTVKEVIFSDDSKLEILSEYIFENCVSLKSITIPASILGIGEFAFSESGIEEVVFSDNSNLRTIGEGVFTNCQFLKSITIPDTVTHIGAGSFGNATIETVLFGVNSQCTTIDDHAFRDCRFLKSIEIPSSVLRIGKGSFLASCIQTIVFTDDSRLETIAEFAFRGCKSLQSITIPSSVVAIDDAAFYESRIEEILFADNSNLKTIGKSAFHKARLSKPIQIPISVIMIGERAFKECFFTEIIFAEKSKLKTIHIGAFNYCRFESIKIPDSVVTIAERAFAGCDKLEEVILSINSQLETIGEAAFLECSSLKSFIFPQSLREIGRFAFSLCNLPKSITLSSPYVEFLGDPFTNSGVDEIIFGDSGKTQTTEKNNHFLQLCKEGDFSKCMEYLACNDVNLSYTRSVNPSSMNSTEDAMSIAMTTKNVDLITFLIKNKVLMYTNCKVYNIKKCFTDDIFESAFFESATVFWYSIYSFSMRKMYKFIRRLLKMLKSKEYVEEWVNIFKNSHQITPLQCVTQGDSFDLYHFLLDNELVKVADLEVKTVEMYFQLAFKFGNVAVLKKSLEIVPLKNFPFKFTNFLMCAPQDKLYSLIEYTLPYIMKHEELFGLVVKSNYNHPFVRFPETVLSYLAYAQAFDAFKYIIENVPNTQYSPSHLVACSLFRGYNDVKRKGNVDMHDFVRLFDYILQDDIRPHVLGEDKEWIGKSIFTCIRYGSSDMCMKLFSYGFDKDDVYIDVVSGNSYNSLIRYSLLSRACRFQSLEVVQHLIDMGVSVDGLLPNHTSCSNDSNVDDKNCINIVYEDEDEDGIQCESQTKDKHRDVSNPEKFVFRGINLKNVWFEPYFNPYRLNKNQDVEIYYEDSRPFDPSVEDPLDRFLERDRGDCLTLLIVTPLGAAIYSQNVDLVRLLLKNGANPNANTFSGFPHLFVLGAGEVIDLGTNISIKRPEVEYPVIDVPSHMQGKNEEQEQGKKIKIENKSEDKNVTVSIPISDTKFTIFQELVNYGADLFHKQTVYYVTDTTSIASREFNIYELCTHLNFPLDLLRYLQTIPQLCDKIKKHYIDSFRPIIVGYSYTRPLFSLDTVDYMFQSGYLSSETYTEDKIFKQALTLLVTYYQKDLRSVLEKYDFHFANLTSK